MPEELPNISDTSSKTPIGDGNKNLGDKGPILGGNPNLTKNPPSLPGAPGGLPGAPGAVQNTPEEDLNIASLDEIYLDYKNGVSDGNIKQPKDLNQVYSYLQDRNWTEARLERLMLQFEFKSIPKFLEFIISKKYKKDEKIYPQIGSQPGVGVVANDLNKNVRSNKMSKVVINPDGTLGMQEAKSASASVERLVKASFKLEQSVKELGEAKIKKAGMLALRRRAAEEAGLIDDEGVEGEEGSEENPFDMGGMDDLGLEDDMGGDPMMEKLEEILSEIKDIKGDVDEVENEFESFEGQDTFNASTAIAKAKDSVRNALAAVKLAKEDEKKGFPFFGKKDKKDDKDKDDKDDKKDKDKKDKKDDKKDKKDDKKEASVDDVIDQITTKLAELRGVSKEDVMKEANMYPFKENKEYAVDGNPVPSYDINAKADGPRKETIVSDLAKAASAMSPAKDGSTLVGESVDGDYDKREGKGISESIPADYNKSDKISMAEVSKLRQSDVKNTFDKARLSFELASQQQFKGLLSNPLKEAFVNEMVSAGIEKTAAEDIAHNAFIDGFEKNQQVVLAELNTFMNKDINEFVKVARYTQEFKAKQAGESIVDEITKEAGSEEEITKTASLRPSPTGSDTDMFKSYWVDAAAKSRKW